MKKMLEINFRGRGGQGVVIASQILGLAFFRADMYPQCYSLFGGERRGAPVVSFLRVDEEKILLKCEIKRAHELVYLDANLINPKEVFTLLRPRGRILVNTNQPKETFEELSEFSLGLIDAQAIADELGLGKIINTTILGAYCRFTERLSLENLSCAIEEMVPDKREPNLEAARQAYAKLVVHNSGRATSKS